MTASGSRADRAGPTVPGDEFGAALGQRWRAWATSPEFALVLLSLPILLLGLGSYSWVNGDEAIYQGISEQMVESGDWLRIQFISQHRIYDTFMNAPLHYWVRALLITCFGSQLWAARLPSALFGIAGVLLTCRMARELGDRRSGFLAGLVQLTTFQFVFLHSARTAELETAVSFMIALCAFTFIRASSSGRSFVANHLCLAVLLNLKLPLVVLPVSAVLLCFALLPETRSHFRRWIVTGLWVLPWALCWHVFQAVRLGDEALQVAATMAGQASGSLGIGLAGGDESHLGYYTSVLLFGAYPYVFAYPLAVFTLLARTRAKKREQNGVGGLSTQADGRDDWTRWAVYGLFVLSVLAFYGIVTKRAPWYIVPIYPFLSIFVGRWLADLVGGRLGRLEIVGIALVSASLLWAVVPLVDYNPFVLDAVQIPMQLGWRNPSWLGAAAGVLLTASVLAAAGFALRARWPERFGPALGCAFVGLVAAVALVRVALPLRHRSYQSPVVQLHQSLETARAADTRIFFPIEIPPGPFWVIRYYFARDYLIRPNSRDALMRSGSAFRLVGRRDDPLESRPQPQSVGGTGVASARQVGDRSISASPAAPQ